MTLRIMDEYVEISACTMQCKKIGLLSFLKRIIIISIDSVQTIHIIII